MLNIIKALERKNSEFYTNKPKNEKSFRVVLKTVHYSTATEEIKVNIETLNRSVTNV